MTLATVDTVSNESLWSLGPGEIVLLTMGVVLSIAVITVFYFIVRTALREEKENK